MGIMIKLLLLGGMCGLAETLAELIMPRCEFEPHYSYKCCEHGQKNLGKSPHLACFIDQSNVWYTVRRDVTI